jgi:hypothetical protein
MLLILLVMLKCFRHCCLVPIIFGWMNILFARCTCWQHFLDPSFLCKRFDSHKYVNNEL